MGGSKSFRALSLALALSACGHVQEAETSPEEEPARFTGLDLFLGEQSSRALQQLRIEREPVGAILIPMALNRLVVTVASLNPSVPDLGITMVQTGQGWQLGTPSFGEIAGWLQKSDARASGSAEIQPQISLELCVALDGRATSTWTEGIAVAIGRERAEAYAKEPRPLSNTAKAWLQVLREAVPLLERRAPALARPFGLIAIDATIAAGNRASSDGFAWGDRFIGINLEAFGEAYGEPDDGAVDRMTRIVAHEYVHLLTYALYPDHREIRDTPLNRALWTMFFEGIGDYVSVSSRWKPDASGAYSPATAQTLERLEPVFVDRLEALSQPNTAAEESELRAGISMGKFDEKWGSLPVALWLHTEAVRRGEQEVLASTIRLNRESVLPLALRNISPEYESRVIELMVRDSR